MSRVAQAPRLGTLTACATLAARSACLCLATLLAGCGAGGFGLSKADVDPNILTSSTGGAVAVDPERASDEATIRNAVSAADIETTGGAPLPWANPQTGSRGTISSLVEDKSNSSLCRSFTTSRESFAGVSLYQGTICMVPSGAWKVQDFQPL